jgi:hypothetical protein
MVAAFQARLESIKTRKHQVGQQAFANSTYTGDHIPCCDERFCPARLLYQQLRGRAYIFCPSGKERESEVGGGGLLHCGASHVLNLPLSDLFSVGMGMGIGYCVLFFWVCFVLLCLAWLWA